MKSLPRRQSNQHSPPFPTFHPLMGIEVHVVKVKGIQLKDTI